MGDSIFDFGDKFNINSPWEKSDNSAQGVNAPRLNVSGYWSSDADGVHRITSAPLYDSVYFQLRVSGIKSTKSAIIRLYEADQFSDTRIGYSRSVSVGSNGKASSLLKIKVDWRKYLRNDYGSNFELFWKVEIDGQFYSLSEKILNVYEDQYFTAIFKDLYRYTCHCGWVDKTHAFTNTSRKELGIGFRNLWWQLLNEKGTKSNLRKGFLVVYTQDAKIGPLYPGITKKYLVQYGLSRAVKEQVALTILQEVSILFEAFQATGAIIGRGSSSFEPADLTSNLLSFYRIVRPKLDEDAILKKCGEMNLEKSVSVYKKYPGTFVLDKYKSYTFEPKFFPNDHCKSAVFPPEFQEIKTIKKDPKIFEDWISIFDDEAGTIPIIGP